LATATATFAATFTATSTATAASHIGEFKLLALHLLDLSSLVGSEDFLGFRVSLFTAQAWGILVVAFATCAALTTLTAAAETAEARSQSLEFFFLLVGQFELFSHFGARQFARESEAGLRL